MTESPITVDVTRLTGLRPGRHHRHGLSAAWYFITVNARELRYWLARAPRAGAAVLTLALFVLFTLTG